MDSIQKIEGARAFNFGLERNRCPYAPGSALFREWVEGWKHQKAELEKRLEYERDALRLSKAS